MSSATSMAKELKGLDTSKVEVDDEQAPPAIEAGSDEERDLLAQMDSLLQSTQADAIPADEQTKLLCLRGRKYDPERAAQLLPQLEALKREVGYGLPAGAQLVEDIKSCKIVDTGARDAGGRGVLWLRLRYHDPKKSKADDMKRLVTNVMLSALNDPEVQRKGLVIVQDMNGLKLKNLDPKAGKELFGSVFPRLPIRIGRIIILNPPWFVGHVLLPVVFTLMSKKLRGRITLINGNKMEPLLEHVGASMLPPELGGTHTFNEAKWAQGMIAALPASRTV